ncbi:MAG: Chromate resistance protein ChrB [Thermomicrobiales bacterium]
MTATTTTAWRVLIYRVPTEPASGRVGVWRDLKQLGALYLQQCACIVPAREDLAGRITRITTRIDDLGGSSWLLEVPTVEPVQEERLIAAFRDLRNKEYAEIVEECETRFVKEVEFEHFRQNYTFEESEEIGQDLEKIRRWFDRVRDRDWFDADGRREVEERIAHCVALLAEFEEEVYRRADSDLSAEDAGIVPLPREASGLADPARGEETLS